MELPGFRKLEYSMRAKKQDNSDYQSGNNPKTQGDGWLDFFNSKHFHIKLSYTLLVSL